MRTRTIGIILMLCAIGLMGFQIGATAKNENNDLFYLIPIGTALLVVGLLLWFRDMKSDKPDKGKG